MTQEQALKILKTGANVFLTGEPGSGKTYVTNLFVSYLRAHGIEPAITASTGIAATHLGGMTIHSWSGIGIKDRLNKGDLQNIAANDGVKKRVTASKVLIIDEISMLPPTTLQMIDAVCRRIKQIQKPFGGMQIVLVGDFFQLPPVQKNYRYNESQDDLFDTIPPRFAYDSPLWLQAEFTTCYITEQYRQDDDALLSILSKIRSNSFDHASLTIISQRKIEVGNAPDSAPKLYSHNVDVDTVNTRMLSKLHGEERLFQMQARGNRNLINAMKKGCLSPECLYLKVGASVMFTKNNSKEGFVNGTLGVVEGFSKEKKLPLVRIRNGRKIEVASMDWTVEENGEIRGRISQIPLRLAWAITVHKSQGVSLDEAVIDLSRVFEFGQGYVALSRVRRIVGIHLLGWNDTAFRVDPEVLERDQQFRIDSDQAEREFSELPEEKLNELHRDFIIACGGSLDPVSRGDKIAEKISTYDQTLKLWHQGKDMVQIAKSRNLSQGTILNHIEQLAQDKKIKCSELIKIVPANLLPDLPQIQAVFKKLATTKLSPVFEYYQGEYSYETLRIARMTME